MIQSASSDTTTLNAIGTLPTFTKFFKGGISIRSDVVENLISISHTGYVYWNDVHMRFFDYDIQNNRIPDIVEGLRTIPSDIPLSTCELYCLMLLNFSCCHEIYLILTIILESFIGGFSKCLCQSFGKFLPIWWNYEWRHE